MKLIAIGLDVSDEHAGQEAFEVNLWVGLLPGFLANGLITIRRQA